MLKKLTLKNFSLFIFSTTFLIILLCCFINYIYSAQIVTLAVVFSLINTYIIICALKAKFPAESEGHKNFLKNEIEYSPNHFKTILNNLPLVAYVVDLDYKFLDGNIEALKYFDVEDGRQLDKLSENIFERDTMEQMKEENEFIIKNKKPFVTDRVVKLKNGKSNWFRIRKVPILKANGDVESFVILGRNIDIERNAQRQRETYISTLSHDLKIPTLAQIRALELLVNESMGTVNDAQKEILNLTLDSCHCMYDMLSTILTTYKYENNDITLNYEKVHMLKLLDESFTKSNKAMHHKNIQLKVKAKDKFVSFYADKIQMKKAFENLIDFCVSNAYKDTEIVCEIEKIDNSIYITLGFESPYVTRESVKNMFKMYTTSAEKFDKVGSSLNLYLAKQIINAHNGTILVQSKHSNYNRYSIEIPCINECKISAIAC